MPVRQRDSQSDIRRTEIERESFDIFSYETTNCKNFGTSGFIGNASDGRAWTWSDMEAFSTGSQRRVLDPSRWHLLFSLLLSLLSSTSSFLSIAFWFGPCFGVGVWEPMPLRSCSVRFGSAHFVHKKRNKRRNEKVQKRRRLAGGIMQKSP